MPIDKNIYHSNFKKRARACIKRARHTCQHCGIKRGEEYLAKTGRVHKAVIQAHHPDSDPQNPRAVLIALCKSCHLKADGPMHGRNGCKSQDSVGQICINQRAVSAVKNERFLAQGTFRQSSSCLRS